MKRLALLLLLLPLLSGCYGATGRPVPADRRAVLREKLEELDRLSPGDVGARQTSLQADIAGAGKPKDRDARNLLARNHLLVGYCWERRGAFDDARNSYAAAGGSEYESVGSFRVVQVAEYVMAEQQKAADDPDRTPVERQDAAGIAEIKQKEALQALETAAHKFPAGSEVLLRDPPVATLLPARWYLGDIRHEAYQRLDKYHRERLSYRIFERLVNFCGGVDHNASYVLALILLAVLAKVITMPMTAAQFRSMRALQAVQPELRKLQEKLKNDKQQLARAQMDLFRAHKVNPASSCLPMLIQMPILIWVYYGIRYFIFRFENVPFLYIKSLANPDVLPIGETLLPGPLLLLYGVSMYLSQKLISAPAATPEQQQQQKLMTYMMPVLFVLIMKGFPAAFILYWFFQNILMTGHQYLIMRPQRAAAGNGGSPAPSGAPPAEAIEKLSQGSKAGKKKKKKPR